MQLKWIGAFCVIAGCGGWGFSLSVQHMRKIQFYKRFLDILENMECELQYRATALPDLCRYAGETSRGILHHVFLLFAQELDSQIAPDAHHCMLAVLGNLPAMNESYYDMFVEFSRSLGAFDLSGQLQGLAHTKQICREKADDLNENKSNRLRSYQALGLCIGAALAILFV